MRNNATKSHHFLWIGFVKVAVSSYWLPDFPICTLVDG